MRGGFFFREPAAEEKREGWQSRKDVVFLASGEAEEQHDEEAAEKENERGAFA